MGSRTSDALGKAFRTVVHELANAIGSKEGTPVRRIYTFYDILEAIALGLTVDATALRLSRFHNVVRYSMSVAGAVEALEHAFPQERAEINAAVATLTIQHGNRRGFLFVRSNAEQSKEKEARRFAAMFADPVEQRRHQRKLMAKHASRFRR